MGGEITVGSDCGGCITFAALEVVPMGVATAFLDVAVVGSGTVVNGGFEFLTEGEDSDGSTMGNAVGICDGL